MLTTVGRAAARRVLAVNRRSIIANGVANTRATFAARDLPIRSFSNSASARQATSTESTEKPKKATKAKKATKPKVAKPKPRKVKKTVTKKKASPKKAAPKKPKKELTPEEAEKKRIKELKAAALLKEEPKPGSKSGQTEWTVFVSENTPTPLEQSLADHVRDLSSRFKDLSSSEKERLTSQAEANRQAYQDKRKAWLASLDVADVYTANLARSHLRKLFPKKHFSKLEDERLPKKPLEGINLYVQERMKGQSGGSTSSFSEVIQEWKNMDASQRQSYMVASEPALAAWRQAVEQLLNAVAEKKKAKKDAVKAAAAAAKAAQIQAREERKAAKAASA